MRRATFKNIEAILRDYPDYDRYIAEREQAILYPDSIYSDENIGGGRTSRISNPTQQKALTIADDKRLNTLIYYRNAIERIINNTDPITNQIIREYYFARPQLKTWEGVAFSCNMSSSNCRKLRDRFFDRLADELGFIK